MRELVVARWIDGVRKYPLRFSRLGGVPRFLILSAACTFPFSASAEEPLTPVLGVSPERLDFGCVEAGTPIDVTVDLFNGDSSSSPLEVTEIAVDGNGFSLIEAPHVPFTILDGNSTVLVVRFRPTGNGGVSGRLRIVAPGAIGSPLDAPLMGAACDPSVLEGRFIIKFRPDAFGAPPPIEGDLEGFTFRYPRLRSALERSEVVRLRRALPEFTPDQVHTNASGEEIHLIDMSSVYVAELHDPSSAPQQGVANVLNREGVAYAEPEGIRQVNSVPNDPFFALQWGADNNGIVYAPYAKTDIDIEGPQVWDSETGDSGVWVAVLDTGIDSTHVDLVSRVKNGHNYVNPGLPPIDDYWAGGHGTCVAGIIGANRDNGIGVAGTANNVRLAAIKICNDQGLCSDQNIARGIDEAWRRDDILNLSFSGPLRSTLVFESLANAVIAGKLCVATTGNEGHQFISYPAGYRHLTLAVGAVWLNGLRWRDALVPGAITNMGSNYGNWLDVVAPGGQTIVTTKVESSQFPGVYWSAGASPDSLSFPTTFYGTSAATAFVSGIGALVKSTNKRLDGDDLSHIIERTAQDITAHGIGFDDSTGWGLARADAAWWYVNASSKQVEQAQVTPQLVAQTTEMRGFMNYSFAPGVYSTEIYKFRSTVDFDADFVETPDIWLRTSGTVGVQDATGHDRFEEPLASAHIVSVTPSQVVFETYLYWIPEVGWWVPEWVTNSNQARIAFTAVGRINPPVSVPGDPLVGQTRVQLAPNPANGRLEFRISIGDQCKGDLRIYDLTGRLVRVLFDGQLAPGTQSVIWDGGNQSGRRVANGVYLYKMLVNGKEISGDKIILIR
jgi:thermitase